MSDPRWKSDKKSPEAQKWVRPREIKELQESGKILRGMDRLQPREIGDCESSEEGGP